jgi:hypothetical protein
VVMDSTVVTPEATKQGARDLLVTPTS